MGLESADRALARQNLEAAFGKALAAKASDEFLEMFGLPKPQYFMLEAAAAPTPSSAILEFDSPDDSKKVVGTESASVQTMLDRLVTELSEKDPELASLNTLKKRASATRRRDEFFRHAGAVKDQLDRSIGALLKPGPESMVRRANPGPLTQTCWLNRTVRTHADLRALAEVADANEIERITAPRRLEAEASLSLDAIGLPSFRNRSSLTGRGVAVAVIDTEVALKHPYLRDRVIHKKNLSNEPWGIPADHGTAVAGIIAAKGVEFEGIAPEAIIYNYKVLATNPSLNGDDFDSWLAIQQAVEDEVRVANCSWGKGIANSANTRDEEACNAAWGFGLTVVKSAGNKGSGTGTITTPAEAEGTVVVGATDDQGNSVQDYSSRGPTPDGKARPHLVAPGGAREVGLISILANGGVGNCGHGTSFAAPHVTGAIALLLEKDHAHTPEEFRDVILKACVSLNLDENSQGAGLLQLNNLAI